jgi:hypothetical protein
VTFADVDEHRPKTIRAFDVNNREVDLYNLTNYRLNTANSTPRDINYQMTTTKLDVRKALTGAPDSSGHPDRRRAPRTDARCPPPDDQLDP